MTGRRWRHIVEEPQKAPEAAAQKVQGEAREVDGGPAAQGLMEALLRNAIL